MYRVMKLSSQVYAVELDLDKEDIEDIKDFLRTGDVVILCDSLEDWEEITIQKDEIELIIHYESENVKQEGAEDTMLKRGFWKKTTTHTKGPWKAVGSFVVADASNAPEGCSETDLEAYGGYLIAESIFHPPNQALIATATELLEELEHLIYLVNKLSEWEDHTQKARTIVNKAKGDNNANKQ